MLDDTRRDDPTDGIDDEAEDATVGPEEQARLDQQFLGQVQELADILQRMAWSVAMPRESNDAACEGLIVGQPEWVARMMAHLPRQLTSTAPVIWCPKAGH